jgi:hypothetical protein
MIVFRSLLPVTKSQNLVAQASRLCGPKLKPAATSELFIIYAAAHEQLLTAHCSLLTISSSLPR